MPSPKPLASLSSGLLARPGQAKPAMRPQAFSYAATEDLGWNDMGQPPAPVPPVIRQREQLAAAIAPVETPEPTVPVVPVAPIPTSTPRAPVSASRATTNARAAFTLRLDPDRHMRLRLASAVSGQSSQQLVMAALDAFLDAQPEVAVSARQVPTGATTAVTGEK